MRWTIALVLPLLTTVVPAPAKEPPPTLLWPEGLREKEPRALLPCLGEAWSAVEGGWPQPGPVALARMGGRSSRGFLSRPTGRGRIGWPFDGYLPTVDSVEAERPIGNGKPWSEDSFMHAVSDRYVLCLLAKGFRWADGPPPPPRPTPTFEVARSSEVTPNPPDSLVSEGIAACRAGDSSRARQLFAAAAEKGDARGEFLTGMMLLSKKSGVARSIPEGLARLEKAAAAGETDAAYQLAVWYARAGDKLDNDQVVRWARASGQEGHPAAQSLLGVTYRYGVGLPVDYVEAAGWQRLSAAQGEAEGLAELASLYWSGFGVEKDRRESCRLIGLAAEKGHKSSQFSFAYCLSDADISPSPDSALALAWFDIGLARLKFDSPNRGEIEKSRNAVADKLSAEEYGAALGHAEEIRAQLAALPAPDVCAEPTLD